jgi:hypothetical protein
VAHFAKVNDENIVLEVLVTDNDYPNEGHDWLVATLGGRWIQTSYNAATNGFRKNFAGIGFTYDEGRDAFIAPRPFESWELDENSQWVAPIPYPTGDKRYTWNEEELEWTEVENV